MPMDNNVQDKEEEVQAVTVTNVDLMRAGIWIKYLDEARQEIKVMHPYSETAEIERKKLREFGFEEVFSDSRKGPLYKLKKGHKLVIELVDCTTNLMD